MSKFWGSGQKDLLLHRIHSYPAKFPPFLVQKLLNYFEENGKKIGLVADTFCGCGTSALESIRYGNEFWGCDINPVATLIARTKSKIYRVSYLERLYADIKSNIINSTDKTFYLYYRNPRINYWFNKDTIIELYKLLKSIDLCTPKGKYRDFFLTGFSNILKPCSRWLSKSIKPQIDTVKIPAIPMESFNKQVKMMIKAVKENQDSRNFFSHAKIVNCNLLDITVNKSFADIIITSPPYVTSYEYADIHQLSSLWLGYTGDYRSLRKGTIGSEYHIFETEDIFEKTNVIGKTIYKKLYKVDKRKAKSALKYFFDLELSVNKITKILKEKGSIAIVIGNTSYKGIYIDNLKLLALSLLNNNFKNIRVFKRKVSYKILTPYRNNLGRFTSSCGGNKVYSHEYILIGEK